MLINNNYIYCFYLFNNTLTIYLIIKIIFYDNYIGDWGLGIGVLNPRSEEECDLNNKPR